MVRAKSNETARMHFTVFDTDGVTPLTGQAGSCTYILNHNGTASGQTVTISEVGSTGRYTASFTPNTVGDWDLEVTCPDDRVVGESFEVEGIDLDDLNNLSSADIQTVIEDNDLDHIAKVASAGNPVKNTFLDRIMSPSAIIDGYDRTTDSLESLAVTLDGAGTLLTGIDAKTTNLPADPASETNVDANETKIDTLQTTVDALENLSSGDIQQVIEDNDLDHLVKVASGGNPVKNTYLDLIMSSSGVIDSYDRASMSLQTIAAYLVSAGGSFTTIITHLTDIKGAGWVDENLTVIDAIVDAIKAKTDNLPADPASETNVDANETKIDTLQSDVTSISSSISRALGLMFDNAVFDDFTYDGDGHHTGCIMRVYDSQVNADAHVQGSGDQTGLLYKYDLEVTISAGKVIMNKMLRLT